MGQNIQLEIVCIRRVKFRKDTKSTISLAMELTVHIINNDFCSTMETRINHRISDNGELAWKFGL